MYETKRIIVAKCSVRNTGDKVKKMCREMKSIVIPSTTRRTNASRPKHYNTINKKQKESFGQGIEVIQKMRQVLYQQKC